MESLANISSSEQTLLYEVADCVCFIVLRKWPRPCLLFTLIYPQNTDSGTRTCTHSRSLTSSFNSGNGYTGHPGSRHGPGLRPAWHSSFDSARLWAPSVETTPSSFLEMPGACELDTW